MLAKENRRYIVDRAPLKPPAQDAKRQACYRKQAGLRCTRRKKALLPSDHARTTIASLPRPIKRTKNRRPKVQSFFPPIAAMRVERTPRWWYPQKPFRRAARACGVILRGRPAARRRSAIPAHRENEVEMQTAEKDPFAVR